MSWPSKKCNKKIQPNNPMVKNKNEVLVANMFDDSSCRWSISADEDYIVLCLKEDKAFDVVKDNKDVNSEVMIKGAVGKNKNSRPMDRKLKYDIDEEQVRDLNIHEKRSNANQQDSDQDCITPSKEEEEKETVYPNRQQYKDSIRRACQVEGVEDLGMVSVESRDSDQSKSSASSFAFPSLNWEWMESPVQMPRSEGQHQKKKKKLLFVRFQCCRF